MNLLLTARIVSTNWSGLVLRSSGHNLRESTLSMGMGASLSRAICAATIPMQHKDIANVDGELWVFLPLDGVFVQLRSLELWIGGNGRSASYKTNQRWLSNGKGKLRRC